MLKVIKVEANKIIIQKNTNCNQNKNNDKYYPHCIIAVFGKHYFTLAILKRCSVYFFTSNADESL